LAGRKRENSCSCSASPHKAKSRSESRVKRPNPTIQKTLDERESTTIGRLIRMQEMLHQHRESSTIGRLLRIQELGSEVGYNSTTEPTRASSAETVRPSVSHTRRSPKDLTDVAKAHCGVSNLDALARRMKVPHVTLMGLRRGLKKNGAEPITPGTRVKIARNLTQLRFPCEPNDFLWNINHDNKLA